MERKVIRDPRGFVIIESPDRQPSPPAFCPHCRLMMRNSDDIDSWKQFSCCHRCSMKWAAPNREKWSLGWRPEPKELQIEIEERRKIPIGIKLED